MVLRLIWSSAVLLMAMGTAHALTFMVNSEGDQPNANPGNGTAEISPDTGVVTLRSAIEEVNALEGFHTIVVNPLFVSRIQPSTPLPALQRGGVVLQGGGVILDGSLIAGTFQDADGLVLEASNCRVERFRIRGFRGNGIRIAGGNATGNLIVGCELGGVLGEGNRDAGILLENGVQGTVIGGQNIQDANLIAGNGQAGILVQGVNTFSNIFQRNRILENGAGPKGIVIQDGAQDDVMAPEILDINPVRGKAAPNGQVELFVDRGSQAETFVASTMADGQGNFEVDLDLNDFIRKPIVSIDSEVPFTRFLTATTMDINGNTSAISNAVLIRGTAPESAGRVRLTRIAIGSGSYQPDGTLEVFVTVERTQLPVPVEVEVVEVLPQGWTLATSNASGVSVSPAPGSGPNLRWVFNNFTETGRTFSYVVNIPPSERGLVAIEGQATMDIDGIFSVASPRLRRELLEIDYANIDGKVEDINSGLPVACAAVEFRSLDVDGNPRYFAVVDNNGRFRFPMLPMGNYERRVVAPGYSMGQAIEVEVNAAFSTLLFQISALGASTALVRGIVTDADSGAPLSGVFVRAGNGNFTFGTTYTCSSGFYEIPRPIPFPKEVGTPIVVEFEADNYNPASQAASVPEGEAAEVNQGLSKSIPFPSALVGQVVASNSGSPPAGAEVFLQGPVNTMVKVESNGAYVFDAVLDGTYLVRANAPGFEPSEKSKQVSTGAIETLNFTLTPIPLAENPFDINGDGAVNAVDVQLVINAALGISIAPFNADVNGSGSVNAVDVQLVINAALGIG